MRFVLLYRDEENVRRIRQAVDWWVGRGGVRNPVAFVSDPFALQATFSDLVRAKQDADVITGQHFREVMLPYSLPRVVKSMSARTNFWLFTMKPFDHVDLTEIDGIIPRRKLSPDGTEFDVVAYVLTLVYETRPNAHDMRRRIPSIIPPNRFVEVQQREAAHG